MDNLKMDRRIKQARLADLAGISRQAMFKRCKRELAPAMVGALVDLDHALVRQFLADRGGLHDGAPTESPEMGNLPPDVPPGTGHAGALRAALARWRRARAALSRAELELQQVCRGVLGAPAQPKTDL